MAEIRNRTSRKDTPRKRDQLREVVIEIEPAQDDASGLEGFRSIVISTTTRQHIIEARR